MSSAGLWTRPRSLVVPQKFIDRANIANMETSSGRQENGFWGLRWQEHLGLAIGAATAVLVAVKILAVAGWDQNTALGVLAENGTANVLTGTILRVLPHLTGLLASTLLPRIVWGLSVRSTVERAAAATWVVWVVILALSIAPALYVGLGIIFISVPYLIRGVQRVIFKLKKRNRPKSLYKATGETPIGNFEIFSLFFTAGLVMLFSTLQSPWLPPEVMNGEADTETVYVLNNDGERAAVLLDRSRALKIVDASRLDGDYCQSEFSWLEEPIGTVFRADRYQPCPK